jgi:hypothetical protein
MSQTAGRVADRRTRSGRRTGATAPGLGLGLLLGLVLCGPATGQYIYFQGDSVEMPFPVETPSYRLLAMGDLRLVIPDENNEISMSDFGRNVAGVAADKEGWSLESWYGQHRTTDDFLTSQGGPEFAQRQAIFQQVGTTQAIYRKDGRRALGATVQWDDESVRQRVGNRSQVRGPRFSGLWNERVWRFSLGAALTRVNDNEDVTSSDIFGLRHFSRAWYFTFGAITSLYGLNVGGQLELDRVVIDGRSRDPSGFHQDDFTWNRPATRGRISVILPPGSNLQAGVNVSILHRNGDEQAKISWSDRFPDNPGRFNYDVEIGTFSEKERAFQIEGRALYWLGDLPRVSVSASYEDFSSDVVEGANFIGSRRGGKTDQTTYRLGGGLATSLLEERLQVGVEGRAWFRDSQVTELRSSTDTSSRQLGAVAGAEWFPRPDIALRGGYGRQVIDADLNLPYTLQTGNVFSLGVGYVPQGGMISLDTYLRYIDRTPNENGGENRQRDELEFGLYSRLLF